MPSLDKITPFLWFDNQAEAAVAYYLSIFPHSKITNTLRYSDVGNEIHGRAAGTVMSISFVLNGQPFVALNGGPVFTFNEAVSFQVYCDSQEEIDHYWSRLSAGGDVRAQQCGWLKDRFGLSWQVVPRSLLAMLSDADADSAGRATAAMLQMKKMDIAALQRAYAGV